MNHVLGSLYDSWNDPVQPGFDVGREDGPVQNKPSLWRNNM